MAMNCYYRNRGNEGKHETMLTITSATQVAKVTKINNHTSLFDAVACAISDDLTSQISSVAILLLLMAGN